ncbi:hypothetical protein [Alteromonas sp. 14N.309.X.WAT.G.H12]|uniref:hypothetical protein n=1 Tax=Alteromonas sp. 14N.309.X.WAT.G.H12 TaxID=3120824 RepID=UPI002FCE8DBE
MKKLNLPEIRGVHGGISDDAAWSASIGLSAALIGVAMVATGAVLGSYAASYMSTMYL